MHCYTCKIRAATHVSATITPAGYHAFQCEKHAHPSPPWGSDPGWAVDYAPISNLSQKEKEEIKAAHVRAGLTPIDL